MLRHNMAVFQRIFSSKRTRRSFSKDRNDQLQKNVTPKLDKSRIRLVICADSEKGRIPYFDSNAIKLVEETDKNGTRTAPRPIFALVQISSGSSVPQHRQTPKYHFQKLGSDVKVIEEMMFGTAAMAFKGLNVKVHLIRSPPQLMISEVFIPEKPSRDSAVDSESDSNILTSSSADFSSGEFSLPVSKSKEGNARSIPVDVPSKDLDYSTDDDSGLAYFTASGSLRTSFPSPNNGSISSYNSLHRRWMRAQTTSLDGQHRKDTGLVHENLVTRPRKCKLAVGIIFGSHDEKDDESNELFQSFFFSHFALIEGHVEKLRSVVEKAYFNPRSFLPAVMEALNTFRSDIYDLYMAPRLPEPVWLTMTSTTSYKMRLCEKFMETFAGLVTKYNNKNCKFFVSTLLSAVLSHHLAWVATVTPANGTSSNTYQDKLTAKWVDTLTKSHPYNPLWAQLGDLFGAIGFPLKISRTVVIGKKADVVKRFLFMLSYFIRCSEVQENADLQCLSSIVNSTQFEVLSSPSPSEKTLSDGLEQSTSPSDGVFVSKQNSISSGEDNGLSEHVINGKGGVQQRKQLRHADMADNEAIDETKFPHEPQTSSTKLRCNCCLERSDSGYNGANIESSSEQDHKSISTISSNEILRKTSSEVCRCEKVNVVANCANNASNKNHPRLSHVHSDPFISPLKTDHKVCDFKKEIESEDSSIDSNLSTLILPSEELTGMSELYNHGPDSFPICCITSATVPSPPRTERVRLVGRAAPETKLKSAAAKPVSKSQSFSEGKTRSRLTQQLSKVTDSASEAEPRGDFSAAELASFPFDSKDETDSLSKLLLSRPVNQDSKTPPGMTVQLTKSRSITPTELIRQRHLSSTSIDYEMSDPMVHCKKIRIPSALTESGQWQVKAFDRNFGHSLLADYTDHYMSDFVLHGTSDMNFKSRLLNDLQMSVRHSVLDEPVHEAVCVIADTDNWTVEVASSRVMGISPSGCTAWTASKMVAILIESVVEISRLKMSAEFCMMHLEDRLQEIYFRSVILSENLHATRNCSQQELTDMLGCDPSDVPLLFAVAGAHTPSLGIK